MLIKIYKELQKAYGPQNWWPTTSNNKEFEIILGAILTQNTAWKNVEKAIRNLKDNDLIDFDNIKKIKTDKLAQLIKSSGYYNQKAKKIKNFVRFIEDDYNGSVNNFINDINHNNISLIREKLLKIKGIGNETADSILLYAAGKPEFVVDAYTKRIFLRLGIVNDKDNYDEIKEVFTKNIPKNTRIYNEYHALIVKHGKHVCKKKPNCKECCIRDFCKSNELS